MTEKINIHENDLEKGSLDQDITELLSRMSTDPEFAKKALEPGGLIDEIEFAMGRANERDRVQDSTEAYDLATEENNRHAGNVEVKSDLDQDITELLSRMSTDPEFAKKALEPGGLIYQIESTAGNSEGGRAQDTEANDATVEGAISAVPLSRFSDEVENESSITDEAKLDDSKDKAANPEVEPRKITVGLREKKDAYHTVSQDYSVVDVENRIFAVFDGMGGGGGDPAAAARLGGEAAHGSLLGAGKPRTTGELDRSLWDASFAIRKSILSEEAGGGQAVGTIVKFADIEGETWMSILHAGDTRMILYNPAKDVFKDLTPDQSDGNEVTNGFYNHAMSNSDDFRRTTKIPVGKGCRIMLCSDGITGDWKHQFLTDDEMLDAFKQPTADAAAQRFLELSKKADDKTVLILDIAA